MAEIIIEPDTVQYDQAVLLASVEIDQPSGPEDADACLVNMYRELRHSQVWIATVDSALAGMVAFEVDEITHTAWVDALASTPESRAQRLRIGSTLLEYLETELASVGVRSVSLGSVGSANGFYEKQGYTKVGAGNEFRKELVHW